MKLKMVALAVISLTLIVSISGCLGGGEEEEEDEEFEEMTGERNMVGTGEGLAQASPVTIEASQEISLENDMITKVTFSISVEDADEGTQKDNVEEVMISSGENENGTSVNGGSTPYQQTASVTWDGTNYLNSSFKLTFRVTLIASEDQPPGPGIIIWNGVPDRGFSYTVDINYTYHASMTI